MTIAVDLGRKATKQTKQSIDKVYRLTFLRYVASAELGDLVPTILNAQTGIAYLGDQCKPILRNGTRNLRNQSIYNLAARVNNLLKDVAN